MDTIYGYLAGAIDADGYILIRRVVINRANRSKETRYLSTIGISANAPSIPDFFQSIFPATRDQYRPKRPEHRPVHWWEAKFANVREPLRCLLPHLRIKQRQARLTLAMLDLYGQKGVPTDDQWAARQRLYEEVTELNGPRRGRGLNTRAPKLDSD